MQRPLGQRKPPAKSTRLDLGESWSTIGIQSRHLSYPLSPWSDQAHRLGHGLVFAVNGDDVDGEVFGFAAKSALLLADGLAVVFGASPEVNGCGIGFHAYRHGRFPPDLV